MTNTINYGNARAGAPVAALILCLGLTYSFGAETPFSSTPSGIRLTRQPVTFYVCRMSYPIDPHFSSPISTVALRLDLETTCDPKSGRCSGVIKNSGCSTNESSTPATSDAWIASLAKDNGLTSVKVPPTNHIKPTNDPEFWFALNGFLCKNTWAYDGANSITQYTLDLSPGTRSVTMHAIFGDNIPNNLVPMGINCDFTT